MADKQKATIGMSVYAADGTELGHIRGFDEDGFFVTTREGLAGLSIEHERAGHEFGEAELMWRCSNCGEMGDIEAMPDSCPNCGVEKEQLYYWTED
ncbi:rubredoxin-like domain-containing protein [Haloferax sp. DFSO60]|uniref:DUF7130 family rubredoxin-like protein n=1 Tax=Haloferax sp. DFSO60 TaxID=3388652 RepID=UPI003978D45E